MMTTLQEGAKILTVNRAAVSNTIAKIPGDISVANRDGITIAATCLPVIDGINGSWRGAIVRMVEDQRVGFRITAEMHPLAGQRSAYPTLPFRQDEDGLTIGETSQATDRNMMLRTFEQRVDDGNPTWVTVLAAAGRLADTARLLNSLREQVVDDQDLDTWSKFSRVPGQEGDRWSVSHTGIKCDGVYNSHVCTGSEDVEEVRHMIQHLMLSVAVF